jgi:hypothetical protein
MDRLEERVFFALTVELTGIEEMRLGYWFGDAQN